MYTYKYIINQINKQYIFIIRHGIFSTVPLTILFNDKAEFVPGIPYITNLHTHVQRKSQF